ncbi:MAG TPA: hypothetical protein VE913_10245 [Longimicrobium sp.]|nr:hypothetical protein [Longimicrobium sp.]
MKSLPEVLSASSGRVLAILCVGMLSACAPLTAPAAKPHSAPTATIDAVASRLGVAASPDYHEARASLFRMTAEWNDSVPPNLESEARELMRHTATLDAMKRRPEPAGEWDALIARAKALARASRR